MWVAMINIAKFEEYYLKRPGIWSFVVGQTFNVDK